MTLPEEIPLEESPPEDGRSDPLPAASAAAPNEQSRAREPLHFAVIVLLISDVVFGLGLAVFAEKVLMFRPMAIMGCGLAALGVGILAYFVLFGGGKKSSRWW